MIYLSIVHYSGPLGTFDYDDTEFAFADESSGLIICREVLHYIGHETDGSKIRIPEGIKLIKYMFYKCECLVTPVKIPEGVENCEGAFKGCKNLKAASELPKSVRNCARMYADCEALEVPCRVIPNNVGTTMEMYSGCVSLKSVSKFLGPVKNTQWMYFNCQSIELPARILDGTEYCDCMYKGCKSLKKKVKIPESVISSAEVFHINIDKIARI